MLHPTEKYYPLRPEFAESTFYLYQATKGLIILLSLDFQFQFVFHYIHITCSHEPFVNFRSMVY